MPMTAAIRSTRTVPSLATNPSTFRRPQPVTHRSPSAWSHHVPTLPLRERLAHAKEDLEIFTDLQSRARKRIDPPAGSNTPLWAWKDLAPSQIAALVTVERRARLVHSAERDRFVSQLMNGEQPWAQRYPLHDRRVMERMVDDAHDYLRTEMVVTVNVPTNLIKDGKRVIDHLLSDPHTLFRSTWETGLFGGTPTQMNTRGTVDEGLGYTANLKRTTDRGADDSVLTRDPTPVFPQRGGLALRAATSGRVGPRTREPRGIRLTPRHVPLGPPRRCRGHRYVGRSAHR
jgi:hypothetical protein